MQAFCKKKNADPSKPEGVLVLKSIYSESVYVSVLTYQIVSTGIWAVGPLNQLFIRGLYTKLQFSKR